MTAVKRNDKLVDGLRSEYVGLYAPTTAWGNVIGMYQGLPKLRAYWPFSSIDDRGTPYDMSEQGRSASAVSASVPVSGTYGLISYVDMVRASSQYYQFNDSSAIDFATENLTIAGWFNFDAASTGNLTGLVSKYLAAGNLCTYRLWKSATNVITFTVNGVGAAANDVIVAGVAADYVADSWLFIAGRYTAQAELAIFINGNWYTNVNLIPAALFNTAQALYIGRTDGGNYFDGQLCHIALCGYAVPNTMIETLYAHTKPMFMGRNTQM